MRHTNKRAHITFKLALIMYLVAGHGASYAESAPGSKPALVARGEHLARAICATCHVVATDQEIPPILLQRTPSFSVIANRPDTTARSLEHFITTTHWDEKALPMTMPSQMLTQEELKAVTAYILSLRKL